LKVNRLIVEENQAQRIRTTAKPDGQKCFSLRRNTPGHQVQEAWLTLDAFDSVWYLTHHPVCELPSMQVFPTCRRSPNSLNPWEKRPLGCSKRELQPVAHLHASPRKAWPPAEQGLPAAGRRCPRRVAGSRSFSRCLSRYKKRQAAELLRDPEARVGICQSPAIPRA
jgi:hypothetical protein